jgi:hypothetical protein
VESTGNEEPRVKFGPRDNQEMPLSWAQEMLRTMYEKRRKQFGDLLREVVIKDG